MKIYPKRFNCNSAFAFFVCQVGICMSSHLREDYHHVDYESISKFGEIISGCARAYKDGVHGIPIISDAHEVFLDIIPKYAGKSNQEDLTLSDLERELADISIDVENFKLLSREKQERLISFCSDTVNSIQRHGCGESYRHRFVA